jgi:hypothetical protein
MDKALRRSRNIDQTLNLSNAWVEFELDAVDLIVITPGAFVVEVDFSRRLPNGGKDYGTNGDTMLCPANATVGFNDSEMAAYSYFRVRNAAGVGTNNVVHVIACCKGN